MSQAIDFKFGVRIPMRDGVQLSATLYIPSGEHPPAPCIFTLTPYISDSYHPRGVYFASHGLPFAIVNSRGRGGSQGDFDPMVQEIEDGHDVVEWLARQPFCNGKVGMWGGSYGGADQWATAKAAPPHLATIVPAAAAHAGVDFPFRNNVSYPYVVQWLTYTAGAALQSNMFADERLWGGIFRRYAESGNAFATLAGVLDARAKSPFERWLQHPHPDAYWDAFTPSNDDYARFALPVLTITGIYDDDQPGALEYYWRHLQYGARNAREQHYLIIGPWDHAGTRTPTPSVGGLPVGAAGLLDLNQLHLEWYRWTMAGGPKPDFLQKRVAYYVMGAEQWRYADTLEGATAEHKKFFLRSQGSANDVFASGALSEAGPAGPPDSYVFDPVHNGIEIELEERADKLSALDQAHVMAMTGRQLVYHSAAFDEDTEVTGFFKLDAWISIDTPDTDFYLTIYDVGLDGRSVRLTTDVLRARYRESLREAKLVQNTEPLLYRFDRATFVSRTIRRGHRLRLVIAPLGRFGEFIFVQKNYNGGGDIAFETAADARTVTVRLHHDEAHPSVLHVPIGQPL